MMKETDIFYDSLPQVEIPADLQAKLLEIPQKQEAPAIAGRIGPRRLRLYAACLLILLPIAGYALWNMPRSDTQPVSLALAADKAAEVANLAVESHEAKLPLAVTSNDRAAVEAALQGEMKPNDMPFPAIVPAPKTALTLEGGGVCRFGSMRAVFTRWSAGSKTYTLYQFDGKPLDIKPGFNKTIVSAKGYKVSIWPGYENPCTWALVSSDRAGLEAFD
ncbi:MAG TPA: hypothetical protein VM008_00930 [Phycisphaerae bacterium]|nr:hypothetical protein [Phycisphaerae bacterium]